MIPCLVKRMVNMVHRSSLYPKFRDLREGDLISQIHALVQSPPSIQKAEDGMIMNIHKIRTIFAFSTN